MQLTLVQLIKFKCFLNSCSLCPLLLCLYLFCNSVTGIDHGDDCSQHNDSQHNANPVWSILLLCKLSVTKLNTMLNQFSTLFNSIVEKRIVYTWEIIFGFTIASKTSKLACIQTLLNCLSNLVAF